MQEGQEGPFTIHFNNYTDGGKVGKADKLEVDVVIGADGANSRVAKEIDAGDYDYAIAFQVPTANARQTHVELCNQIGKKVWAVTSFAGLHRPASRDVLKTVVKQAGLSEPASRHAGAHPNSRGQDELLQGPGRDVCGRRCVP